MMCAKQLHSVVKTHFVGQCNDFLKYVYIYRGK